MKHHYGMQAIKDNLAHFLLGKTVSAVSSLAVMLLVARILPVAEFAAYTVFQALVLLVQKFSDFGAGQTVVRYVPELRSTNNNFPMYRLIFRGTLTRLIVVPTILGIGWLTFSTWAPLVNLEQWLPWLTLYIPVGMLRLMNSFVSRAMESLLWQKFTQYSMAAGALVRLAAVIWMIDQESFTLYNVILMDLISEGLILVCLTAGFFHRWSSDPRRSEGNRSWLRDNRARLRRFGAWGYLQTTTSAFYGGSANRVAASAVLMPFEVGLFGFVDSLTQYGQRYLPTRMAHGMIQPIFFARYSQSQDFSDLARLANLMFRISLFAVGLPTVVLLAGGSQLLDWVSAGKYGQAAYLIAGMMGVLSLDSLRSQMQIMMQAVERNEIFPITNLVLSISFPLALVLVPYLGLWSFVASSGISNILALSIMTFWLRRLGLNFRFEWWLAFKAVIAILASGFIGAIVSESAGNWLGICAAVVLYPLVTLIWPPITAAERSILKVALKNRKNRKGSQRKKSPEDY